MPPQKSDVKYWDSAAKYWEDMATVNPYWAWNSFYSGKIPDKKVNVLVVGVTNGAFLRLLKEFRPQAWVCGIDLSYEMIRHAQTVEENVVCGRGNALPFKSETFHVVLSDYFLSVIKEDALERTVHEIRRVLKKDGLLLAKELRHRGHTMLWVLLVLVTGALAAATLFVSLFLSGFFWVLCGLALLGYNPVTHTMGRSAAAAKLVVHIFKFVKRRKRIPTLTEIRELHYLSKKYLHIFTDGEMNSLFSDFPLEVDLGVTHLSWNFSLVGVKK